MSVIKSLNETKELKHLFILSHKFIWAPEDSVMQVIYKDRIVGDNYRQYNDTNFYKLMPVLKMAKKPIYWITGDLKPLPIFHKKNDITYIATHIYDVAQDAVIQVKISKDNVTFYPISLSGKELEPLEHYNVKYWEDWYAKNKSLLPEKELARYEVKIPIPFTSLSEVTPCIMLDQAGFSKEYPDRIVNSLYYDSHNLDSYADNLSGGGCRTKFRLRWYNEGDDMYKANS